MWYVITGMGTFMMCLLISLLCLRSEVESIKNNRCSGCEAYIDSVMREHECLCEYCGRPYKKARSMQEAEERAIQLADLCEYCGRPYKKARSMQEAEERAIQKEMCSLRNGLKQIRYNEIFCSLDREITIKEALQMLFSYLKLKIKPGDDVKIVKIK